MSESLTVEQKDKCPVCGGMEFWFFNVEGRLRLCTCTNCGVAKITEKCKAETQKRFDEALKCMEGEND